MFAMHTHNNNDEADHMVVYLSAQEAAANQAAWRQWIGQTVLLGGLGAIALAIAVVLLPGLFTAGGSAPHLVIAGVIVSGAVVGALGARHVPGELPATLTSGIMAGIVTGTAVAGLGIAGLRALWLAGIAGQAGNDGLGAIYTGIALSAALLFASGLGLLLHASRLDLRGWRAEDELAWVSEMLALA